LIGPLATGTDRCVKRDVAKKIEGIRLRLVGGRPQLIEADAPLFKTFNNFGSLFGVRPPFMQISGRRVESSYLLSGVIGVLDDTELFPVEVEFVDQVCGDLNLTLVEVELAPLVFRIVRYARFAIPYFLRIGDPGIFINDVVPVTFAFFVDMLLGNKCRVASRQRPIRL